MYAKNVFVSFDYENDKHYKFLLEAWDANTNFKFRFADKTAHEISSYNVDRVKSGLSQKIKEADYTLVIVGQYANSRHKDANLIGEVNWINWEIKKSLALGNKLVGVKIDKNYTSPSAILGQKATWAMSFNQDAIIKALQSV